jgi:small-conductance mechanosensitive channel
VVVALWVAGVIEGRLMRVESLDSSLRMVGVRVAKALLTVGALITSLSLVGIDMTALSVFTGALGVGLGFGLQKIASNYVSAHQTSSPEALKIRSIANRIRGVSRVIHPAK